MTFDLCDENDGLIATTATVAMEAKVRKFKSLPAARKETKTGTTAPFLKPQKTTMLGGRMLFS